MSKRILIVDDSAMMRKIIAKALQPSDHVIVGEAKSGAQGVEMYKELNPDLVTMDITMRDMDGLTAAREILKYDGEAKILFLSNLNEDRYRDELESIGAIGFAGKHNSDKMLELIDKA